MLSPISGYLQHIRLVLTAFGTLALFCAGVTAQDSVDRVSPDFVERVLAKCPSPGELQWSPYRSEKGELLWEPAKDAVKIEALKAALFDNMKLLARVPSETVRLAVERIARRSDRSTTDFKLFRQEHLAAMIKAHPKDDSGVIDVRIGRLVKRDLTRMFWIDRFLFDAPRKEVSSAGFISFSLEPVQQGAGFVDQSFPVIVTDGVPTITSVGWGMRPMDIRPSTSLYLAEFEFYLKHYKRRKAW